MTISNESKYLTLTMSLVAITTVIIAATLYVLVKFLLDEAADIEPESSNGEVYELGKLFNRS